MLLHDIGKSPDATFKKINHHLETNYGFKIAEDVSDRDLVSIMEQIQDEITELKVKGDDAKTSPEISKRLLVLEGITSLREFAMMQLQSPDLDHVVHGLADFVHDSFRLGGTTHADFEECVNDGMKHYRSSKYRFPDEMIEQRVRQEAMAKIQSGLSMLSTMGTPGLDPEMAAPEMEAPMGGPGDHMMEDTENDDDDQNNADEDAEMKGVDLEEEKWIQKAHVKKGGLHKALGVPQGEKIPKSEIDAASHSKNSHLRHMAQFAKNVEEGDQWGHEGKRSSALGGKHVDAPNTPQAKHAMKVLDNPSLSLAPKHDDEQIPMIRDKSGRMVQDPFAAQAAQRRKGIVMKEQKNLVKNLRRLLETEVSQAEVMMAAKGFAQELQEMVEKIGRLQNEDLPPVTDQMRETYGMESASAFQTQIYGALQSVMDALYTAKGQVDDAVTNMAATGQFSAQTDMDVPMDGMDAGADMDAAGADADLDNLDADLGAEDEFGGAEEEEPLGRGMKAEAVQLQKKVLEMQKLVAKARKLREARG